MFKAYINQKLYNEHKYILRSGKYSEPTLNRYTNDDIKIVWSIPNKLKQGVPNKSHNCSFCSLERIAIADANKEKSLYLRNELANDVCPHYKLSYFLNYIFEIIICDFLPILYIFKFFYRLF